MNHELKTWPVYFSAIWDGLKRFEVRLNDREYRTGDLLRLREYDEGRYTGREIYAIAGYIMSDPHLNLLQDDVIVMQLEEIRREIMEGARDERQTGMCVL